MVLGEGKGLVASGKCCDSAVFPIGNDYGAVFWLVLEGEERAIASYGYENERNNAIERPTP